MTEQSSPVARYTTLRDYIAVLRRYRWMIVIIAVIGGGAGAANALRQKAVYQAEAQVGFQDPTQYLNEVGLGSNSTQTPAQLAAVNATTATGPAVMTQVARELSPKPPCRGKHRACARGRRHGQPPPARLSVRALTAAVSAQVQVGSGLLQISATGSNPAFAARLANAVANTLVAQDNRQTRAQFAHVANNLRGRIAALKPLPGGAPSPQLSFYEDELARLDTLAGFATSAHLARPAQPPTGPSSPQKTRDIVLGLLLGLLLGLVAAFVRDSMDRRLRRPDDFESAFDFPVIGHVRNESLGRVAYLSNGSGEIDQRDLESFRILRRNLEFLDPARPPKTVLVTSAVAEEGKTTVASSLALVMAAAGKQTLLVDCDLRRPGLAERMGLEQRPGLSDYLAGAAAGPDILRPVAFSENSAASKLAPKNGSGASGSAAAVGGRSDEQLRGAIAHKLDCIPAGTVTSRGAELLGTMGFKELLESASDKYDVVVLDSSPLLPVADTLEMLPHVDSVVVCARESRTTRDQARSVRAALARFPLRPSGVVVTGIKPRGAEYEVYTYSYSYS